MGFLLAKIENASMFVLGIRCVFHRERFYPVRWKTFVPMELLLMTALEELKKAFL